MAQTDQDDLITEARGASADIDLLTSQELVELMNDEDESRRASGSRSVRSNRGGDRCDRRPPRERRPAAVRGRRVFGRGRGARCVRVRDDVRAPTWTRGGDRRRRGARVRRRAGCCRGRCRGGCARCLCRRGDGGRRGAGHQRERTDALRHRCRRGGCGGRRAHRSGGLRARLAARRARRPRDRRRRGPRVSRRLDAAEVGYCAEACPQHDLDGVDGSHGQDLREPHGRRPGNERQAPCPRSPYRRAGHGRAA